MVAVWLAAAWLMLITHVVVIVVLVAGGPIALRWRPFGWIHLLVAVPVAAVFAVGADCPLTTWHKQFLALAGRPVYDGGFVERYLVQPVTGGGMTTVVKFLVLTAWVVPTVVSYFAIWRQPASNAAVSPLASPP